MDKYLMSSPTQVSQLFIPGDSISRLQMEDEMRFHNTRAGNSHDRMAAPAVYEELPNFSCHHHSAALALDDLEKKYTQNYAKDHLKNFSVDEYLQMPFTMNLGMNLGACLGFQHLRNVSLDDTNYRLQHLSPGLGQAHARAQAHPYEHSHSVSVASNTAEPPSGTFSHLASQSTFELLELTPVYVTLLAASTKLLLLLDSPRTGAGPASSAAAAAATTPGRPKRSSPVSLGNLFSTPLRGSVRNSPGMKVARPPVSHRLNRLRAPLEQLSALLLTSIANMKSSNVVHSLFSNNYVSSNNDGQAQHTADNSFDGILLPPEVGPPDDYQSTSLATPITFSRNWAAGGTSSLYVTPVGNSQSFDGSLQDLSHSSHPHSNSQMNTPLRNAFAPNLSLLTSRNDTFEPMCMEQHEDDNTCAQLRKAKHRPASLRAFPPPVGYVHSALTGERPSQGSAVGLLLPENVGPGRNSALKLYPASIDLASITKTDALLLPMSSLARSAPSMPSSATQLFNELLQFTNLATKTTVSSPATTPRSGSYPNASQIQETSTTEEIAKFAESILKSDMKRPIIVQEDSNDVQDPKKKHKCPLCLARFQRPEHVKRHLKSHSSEKPFQCDMPDCGRRFNRKDNLKAHLKKIHGQAF